MTTIHLSDYPFTEPITDTNTPSTVHVLGADYSTWDDNASTPQRVDFLKAKRNGLEFVFIKASQADCLDSDLIVNWNASKQAGLLRGAYHFLTFDISPIAQMDYFWSLIRNDPGELPPVIDFEYRIPGLTRSTASHILQVALERLLILCGRAPILYTSPGYWSEFGTSDVTWLKYPLWIANYYRQSPTIPAPWTSYRFWQYTDRGDGLLYGSEAKMLDMNYWNGDLKSLYSFAGVFTPPPPPPPPSLEQRVSKLELDVAALQAAILKTPLL